MWQKDVDTLVHIFLCTFYLGLLFMVLVRPLSSNEGKSYSKSMVHSFFVTFCVNLYDL